MNTIRHIILAAALAATACANNINVTNVTLTDLDTVGDTVNVTFDVTWENGWRVTDPPANWDAAWLFVKFHTGDLIWRHASLDTADANHTAPAGSTIKVGLTGPRGVGVFLYRSAPGTGTTTFTGVKLKWPYGTDAVPDNARVSVDVTGIEMVYVPEGAFWVGDGSSQFRFMDGNTGAPFQITNVGPLPVGTTVGKLGKSGLANDTYIDVPTTFPNGFSAIYCMKYEPTQGQRASAANRSGPPVFNNTARQSFTTSGGVVTANFPDRSYHDYSSFGSPPVEMAAYLDWAALRPMTSFEYEKACRGPLVPLPGEWAWGNAAIAESPYTLSGDGTASEQVATGYRTDAGNAWTPPTKTASGPCRAGMFALSSYGGPVSPRVQSGATYYGIMDMTGNGDEVTVQWQFSLVAAPGFVFEGQHGDGAIAALIKHNVVEWGVNGSIGTNSSVFLAWKGGRWNQGRAVSDSSSAGGGPYYVTMRGVRSAP